jgi:tetratricopeptide (TPR) repeat protein
MTATLAGASLYGCATTTDDSGTLATLRRVEPDTSEVEVADSLDRAMDSYRRFLDETPEGEMTAEALRRLADLEIEQQFGIVGTGEIIELPAPEILARETAAGSGAAAAEPLTASPAVTSESDESFEERTTSAFGFETVPVIADAGSLPGVPAGTTVGGPLEAIRIYQKILTDYPSYERADQVLYQMSRAYDEVGQPDEAMAVMQRLVDDYGYSDYLDEVQFRRGEYLFTRRQFREAESAYEAIIAIGPDTEYYELALYKLGWALYKQEFYDLALHRFMALLDHRMSIGYDFDAAHSEDDERRVADTFRVISLSFSNIGGPEVVNEYFAASGRRSFEDRIYSNLGEFYLTKLRYNDAAAVYDSFVENNPFHRQAPRFSMRIVEIYEEGDFPILVVDAKKSFATKYGLSSEYWSYFDPAETPEVLALLKTNLTDLANHYHALYQDESLADDRVANFSEASNWYREFLASFPADPESPSINYQLADLLLENDDFYGAAREYERTAYDYAAHERSAAAGYAAIFAHRENLKLVDEIQHGEALRATIESSLRFADAFPDHENADIVLGAAADDLYGIGEYAEASVAASKLIERYPAADLALRRSAWTVVAHSSLELSLYPEAEHAYASLLEIVPFDDPERAGLTDNLAASIYQQGAAAVALGDDRAAADQFLRIGDVAPGSTIRSTAEYDAASALVRLADWEAAGRVLEDFRVEFPDHELNGEVTKQLASVYRNAGQLGSSASEYERVALESDDPEIRREAQLLAGDLYEESGAIDAALAAYGRYVEEFPWPIDVAQETRFKMAGMYEARGDQAAYHAMLQGIVDADATAGADRTDRSRFLAAQSALELTEGLYLSFAAIELRQPFEESLTLKRQRMDETLAAFESLVAYEVSEVTAAATYHIAEIYLEFSRSLMASERPEGLTEAELLDYELALEEEAFPFEERSIAVHEDNFALVAAGVYNPWVEKSLAKLAVMMPARYAKTEISSGYMGSIDVYSYRTPGAPPEEIVAGNDDETDGAISVSAATSGGRNGF